MEEKLISSEISFIPIGTSNYIEDVEKVIEVIKQCEIEYEINAFSTIIRGEKSKVFQVLRSIFDTMENTSKFVLVIKISNTCGCEFQ